MYVCQRFHGILLHAGAFPLFDALFCITCRNSEKFFFSSSLQTTLSIWHENVNEGERLQCVCDMEKNLHVFMQLFEVFLNFGYDF